MIRITEDNLKDYLDLPNPHLIAVKDNYTHVCGSVTRENRIENKWSIHWNSGKLGDMYGSVKDLISENLYDYKFYFIQL